MENNSEKNSCNNHHRRKISKSSKNKTSQSLKKYYKHNINPRAIPQQKFFWAGIKSSKHKFNTNPQSIIDLSSRTKIKVIQRLKIGCARCGWNDAMCDVHHIKGKKVNNCHHHSNLSYLCPNCHRLVHVGIIPSEELITFEEQVQDEWKKYYYG